MSTTGLLFLTVFGAALLMALVRHPLYGLYAYLATFYLHPVERWWGRDLPDLRWALMAAAVTLFATWRLPPAPERSPWHGSRIARLLLVLTAWLWAQNLWALSSSDHLELSILFTKYVVLFILIYRLVTTTDDIHNFMVAHILGCLYLGWLAWAAPEGGRLEGVGGPGIDEANALGMHLSTGAIAAGALLVGGRWWGRTAALAALPLILNGIIQTQSRGAFLGLVAGGVVMVYLSPRAYRRYWYVFGILGVALLIRAAPENYWDRISTILVASKSVESEEVDQSSRTRVALIEGQWRMFLAYPAGSGHRGTAVLSPRYLDSEHLTRSRDTPDDSPGARSSHNTAMTALTEQGVPGAIIYVAMLWWIFRTCIAVRRQAAADGRTDMAVWSMVAGAMLASVTAAGMFTDYYKAEVSLWGLALLAVLGELARSPVPTASPATAGTGGAGPGNGPRRDAGPWQGPGPVLDRSPGGSGPRRGAEPPITRPARP